MIRVKEEAIPVHGRACGALLCGRVWRESRDKDIELWQE